jgi:hypothetical protein
MQKSMHSDQRSWAILIRCDARLQRSLFMGHGRKLRAWKQRRRQPVHTLIDPRMFEENTVAMIACGTMHAVALTLDSPDGKIPELDKTKFVEIKAAPK